MGSAGVFEFLPTKKNTTSINRNTANKRKQKWIKKEEIHLGFNIGRLIGDSLEITYKR